MSRESHLLAAALSYAARGWLVVPLHTPLADGRCDCRRADCSVGKHPRVQHGLREGTTDPEQIRTWWSMWPGANIGIVTGAESGLVVLDIDPRHNGDDSLSDLQDRYGPLPDTVEALTGSGGRHILFRHPGGRIGNSQGRLGPGLDTRGDGGYIVAAPSLHASGRKYEWEASSDPTTTELADLPVWLPELLAPPERPLSPAGTVAPESAERRARAWLAKREPAVQGQGGDAHTFITAANLVNDFGLSPEQAWPLLWEWNARCQPPWDERGLRAKLESAIRNGKHARGSKTDRPLRSVPAYAPPPHTDDDAPPPFEALEPAGDPASPPSAKRAKQRQQPSEGGAPSDGSAAKVIELKPKQQRPMKSRSYLTLLTILETERYRRLVLGERKIEWDEMGGVVTLGRTPIRDVDYSIIRAEIERNFAKDQEGNGMQFAVEDIVRAVHQVAHQHPYHPVREYLRSLQWDGKARWETDVLDSFGAERSPLNAAMLKKWAIAAVARALQPGCKVDTVLILKGKQGIRKSSWFAVMGGDWYAESTMDLENKESFLVLQRNWIIEWSELEAMSKARDQTAVKAFITKTEDVYVPKYGREAVRVKRSSVIVGTTNEQTFLADPTGNRRYWPISVSRVDLDWAEKWRDQLWAEAVAAFDAGPAPHHWWLTPEENAQLEQIHQSHFDTDPWEELISVWADGRTDGFTIEAVLTDALRVPVERQDMRASKRVGAILRRLGYVKRRVRTEGRRSAPIALWVPDGDHGGY